MQGIQGLEEEGIRGLEEGIRGLEDIQGLEEGPQGQGGLQGLEEGCRLGLEGIQGIEEEGPQGLASGIQGFPLTLPPSPPPSPFPVTTSIINVIAAINRRSGINLNFSSNRQRLAKNTNNGNTTETKLINQKPRNYNILAPATIPTGQCCFFGNFKLMLRPAGN